jgi:glycosyltransferase involved in cell wall biosynthesis
MAASISVVVTCHNYGRYLRECLESLLAQERPADEIVVVDDASTDDTPEVVAFYAAHGVRYERVEHRDATKSYNHGIASTSGDLIAFADADNAATPRWLGHLAAPLESEPGYGFAYSDRYWAGEGKMDDWAFLGAQPGGLFRSQPPDLAMLVHENFIDTMSIVRREAVEAVGGFPQLPILWDYRLWIAILERGWRACYVPEPLYHYRVHPGNMILATLPRIRGNRLLIRREHFGAAFWSPYTHPDLDLDATILPGQALSGVTLCHVALTPRVKGPAYPAVARLAVTLPPGVICLEAHCAAKGATVDRDDGRVAATLPYPVPDGAACAVPPVVHLTLGLTVTNPAPFVAALAWDDLFEREHRRERDFALPETPIEPPFRQPILPGPLQRVRGQFSPGESVSVWVDLPPGATEPSLPLPSVVADEDGTVRIDLRRAPRDFQAIVLRGDRLGATGMLLPGATTVRATVGTMARRVRRG